MIVGGTPVEEPDDEAAEGDDGERRVDENRGNEGDERRVDENRGVDDKN